MRVSSAERIVYTLPSLAAAPCACAVCVEPTHRVVGVFSDGNLREVSFCYYHYRQAAEENPAITEMEEVATGTA
ncbi:MAG TPA: hypothetical protein VHN74_21340 [Candidatus Angelobacter sp.]|jgi:hypothetical protein|nr:hypothetical protein [Candidatus Angelobacter sp.]